MRPAPAFLVTRIARRRSLAAAALVVAALAVPWRRLAPGGAPPAPAPAATYRLVPLSGVVLDSPGGGACLPFLDELLSHPHGSLQIGVPCSSCMVAGFSEVYTVSDGENLLWEEPELPARTLSLTAEERAALRDLGARSCAPDTDAAFGTEYVVAIGGVRPGPVINALARGARVLAQSEVGHAIEAVLASAVARYRRERLGFVGDVRVHLEVAEYVDGGFYRWDDGAVVRGHAVELRHRHRVIGVATLDDQQLVDLADWALAQPAAASAEPTAEDQLRGWIAIGDHHVALASWSTPRALAPVLRALAEARHDAGLDP
jgi:hypothetical protein